MAKRYPEIEAKIAADPELQAALLEAQQAYIKGGGFSDPGFLAAEQRFFTIAKAKGISLPKDYGIGLTGNVTQDSWIHRHGQQVGLGLLAGGIAGGALTGGAAAPAASGGAAGSSVGGAAATAGAGGGSLLHSLLPSIIGAGASLGGTAIASHANTEAAKLQAEQADKALALQKEQYALQRQDTAPYRALGQGAVGNLGYLSGINIDEKVPELSSTVPKVPYGVTVAQGVAAPQAQASLSSLGQPTTSPSMVRVKAPNGQIGTIPADKLPAALAAGGTQVQ